MDILVLSFFGGEPLLSVKKIIELSRWARDLSQINNVSYEGAITTNGYLLTPSNFNKLFDSGVRTFQITLDGVADTHNQQRPTLKGEPTFDKILSNVIEIAHSNRKFNCTIRLNISDSLIESSKLFIENYSVYFQNDKRFFFDFHPIFGSKDLKLTNMQIVKELEDYAKQYLLNIEDVREDAICYTSKPSSFIIRADGKLQKCTVAINKELNNVGSIDKEGNLTLNQTKMKKWVFAQNKKCPLLNYSESSILTEYNDNA